MDNQENESGANWDLSKELKQFNEIVGSISYGEAPAAAEAMALESKKLVEAAQRFSLGMQEYQGAIEEHAKFSDADMVQDPGHIQEIDSFANDFRSGAFYRQVTLLDLERFSSEETLSPSSAKEFASDMKEYAVRLEAGMNEQIKELADIGVAVSSLSHCVKNIVNNLKAGSFVMEKGIKNENYDMMKKGWTMLGKNINRMSDLAMDMLTYSKKRKPDYEDRELNAVLDEVFESCLEKARMHNIQLVKELDPNIGTMYLEHKGIYRSVLNLMSNSIDACEGIENARVLLKSILNRDQNSVRIDVTDNGCGMTEETKQKLFTSFFSTKGSKGTGLGLPTTYKIIKEHGGAIDVESEYGKGTTFSITLPIKPIEGMKAET